MFKSRREETQYWRDDALEAAAVIVERHLGFDAAALIAGDIRAMKQVPTKKVALTDVTTALKQVPTAGRPDLSLDEALAIVLLWQHMPLEVVNAAAYHAAREVMTRHAMEAAKRISLVSTSPAR